MYEVNKYDFYRALCPRYPYYCNECEHEVFDMNNQVWICDYDRFGDAISQISVLETDIVYPEKEN